MSTKEKLRELQTIKADILEKNVCSQLADGATQLVFGDGSPDADILFVGEAPGKNEDLQGLPFVGAAGKFLEEMLVGIGLKRSDVYITNIVKYRPPNNRDPLPSEKEAFLPYLWNQILAISPKLVVTLGRHSMEPFLPGASISNVHGQPKRIKVRVGNSHVDAAQGESTTTQSQFYNASLELEGSARKKRSEKQTVRAVQRASTGASDTAMPQEGGRYAGLVPATGQTVSWVVLPLFHPAAALYNGGMRQTLIDDFNRIPAILKQVSCN